MAVCRQSGCEAEGRTKGFCKKHYNRFYYKKNRKVVIAVNRKYYLANKDSIQAKAKKRGQTVSGRWNRLRADAKRDGRPVEFSKSEFEKLTSLKCQYCGEHSPGQEFVGVDRIDSSKGYTLSNVVPFCTLQGAA